MEECITDDGALAQFSFASLADYEKYRQASQSDTEALEAYRYAQEAGCITSYRREFFRPFLNAKDEARHVQLSTPSDST